MAARRAVPATGRGLFLFGAVIALMTAHPGTALAQAPPNRCGAPGKVYAQTIIVSHKSGPVDTTTLFVVCRPSHTVAIVDSDGGTYKDLADFRAHNHLFGAGDRITLPRDFPAVERSGKPQLVTVSGHTGSSAVWWWATGGILVALATGGGLLVLRARRRRAPADEPADAADDADAQES